MVTLWIPQMLHYHHFLETVQFLQFIHCIQLPFFFFFFFREALLIAFLQIWVSVKNRTWLILYKMLP